MRNIEDAEERRKKICALGFYIFPLLFPYVFSLSLQFAGVQAINTAILDKRPDLRKHEGYVILVICVVCWLLAIPMVFDGGIYLFTLMDWNTASWAILLIGIAEVAEAAWFYGCNKFLGNVAEMGMRFGSILHGYWWLSWVVLAPLTCLVSASSYHADEVQTRRAGPLSGGGERERRGGWVA